ncbi:aldo/keto reductase [Stackebrandtia nassauensis]|uniref:Aldo/keto reductase n=1 Tax=Stackebrandtia nassauensis (strain DSM 44728 / CIP 108903 / NRRL B-16338 / NBRC 102104 / LLR-40K-21) TaxID=446470 RepID=D3Q5U3_STANL|nr:aldo/keto reductase [Stackebrandtia nassauensis]ADD40242.1 aldo/keto reductase [Stackebrandtia nassauensis DSM 44728]
MTTAIPSVPLGSHGPTVGAQGLGCMLMMNDANGFDADEARATLETAFESGVTLFDTADMYGAGGNEEFLAPFFAAHRDEVVIASKFGIVYDGSPGRPFRGDRAYVRQSIEASLRRLNVDVIDLYYMHRLDPETPIEEIVGAMAELVTEGKVRHLGLSEVTAPELRAAAAVHPITAVQSEWSLITRDVETQVVPAAAELGTAFVPYAPLGRGFLAGLFTDAAELGESDHRLGHSRLTGDNALANAKVRDLLAKVAADRGVTWGQVALAWVHQRAEAHGLSVVPIPGTRKRSRLTENLGAVGLELTRSELDSLDPIAERMAGTRYPGSGGGTSVTRE